MKKAEVKIGGKYYANVSGKRTEIQIESEKASGGCNAINLATSKKILIKSAQRLLGAVGARITRKYKPGLPPSLLTKLQNVHLLYLFHR